MLSKALFFLCVLPLPRVTTTPATLSIAQPNISLDVLGFAVLALAPGEALPFSAARMADSNPALALRLGFNRDSPALEGAGCTSQWRLRSSPRWHLRAMRASSEHIAAWHALFQACFGYAMPETTRQWKYQGAAVMGIGVWRGDALVAFYGGMPRAVCYAGQRAMAVQIGDVMVHPSQRGAFTRQGPFQMAAATYLELYIGNKKPYLLGFGFPEDKALRLAEHLGLYAKVDSMVELRWPSLVKHPPSWSHYARVLTPSKGEAASSMHATMVDSLWQRMQKSLGSQSVVGVRDWAYIDQRYCLHPLQCYTLLLVRQRFGGVLGLAVLRDRQAQGLVELVDLVAPTAEFARIVKVCRRFAGNLGRAGLFCWITGSHAHWLAGADSQQSPLHLAIPANIWSSGPSADDLRNRWWLMGGDTDFR